MPNYNYKCTNKDCKHIWTIQHHMSYNNCVCCPVCGKTANKTIDPVPGYVRGSNNPTKC